MLLSEVVRWTSVAFLVAFFSSQAWAARTRGRPEAPATRASKPLDLTTGPLWFAAFAAQPLAHVAAAVVPQVVVGWPWAPPSPLGEALQILGVFMLIAAGALAFWSESNLGRFTTPQIQILEDHQLITAGPYRHIRHPLYTSLILLAVGNALFLLNGAMAGIFLLTYALARRRAMLEEELLSSDAGFGASYQTYRMTTGRFVPRFR